MTEKPRKKALKHKFRDKLLLNQWIFSLFGLNSIRTGTNEHPFQVLGEPLKDMNLEGLNEDNLHYFHNVLANCDFLSNKQAILTKEQLLSYEENISHHTQKINERREPKVVWKYFQWLSLLFVEIYLDRYFRDKKFLQTALNEYVDQFNANWPNHAKVEYFTEEELNKISVQNATGSGKTLLMHINFLQYLHYSKKYGRENDISRAILISPNERLSEQHIDKFTESGIYASNFSKIGYNLFTQSGGLDRVDVLEISKLVDREGPNTFATQSFGDQNLLLVDEGHRGISSKSGEKTWFKNRSMLCKNGFAFEYSATFDQAVSGTDHENQYAKSVVFDYSYRWFYEDGFGKDYRILNLSESFDETKTIYLTACLLKFYQQIDIYGNLSSDLVEFNLEKPLWVFVGNTVSGRKFGKDEEIVATDVAQIISFLSDFLANKSQFCMRMERILTGDGQDTGLLDKYGADIFQDSFKWLKKELRLNNSYEGLYDQILSKLFNSTIGGNLTLRRSKDNSGEITLHVGTSKIPFGLVNVGNTTALADHLEVISKRDDLKYTITNSDFSDPVFESVKNSSSPINILVGSKKFVEGWDCWRVSTIGLMHVGRTEGAQIIQLFGRGVRLKGINWSLKRSWHTTERLVPEFVDELETLNVVGIKADFMDRFRQFLDEEGLPGNEKNQIFTIPITVTHDFDRNLQILSQKRKSKDGREFDFRFDAPIPSIDKAPEHMRTHPVESDWYPRIQSVHSVGSHPNSDGNIGMNKEDVKLNEKHLSLLDFDRLYFELEQYKRNRNWHNLNISKSGIRKLLSDNSWYTLHLPSVHLEPTGFDGINLLQQIATELLKRYSDRYYNYCKRAFVEQRLELIELSRNNSNIPQEENYELILEGSMKQVIHELEDLKKALEETNDSFHKYGELQVCQFGIHLYQPLLHVKEKGKITVKTFALNESEFQFVNDFKKWSEQNKLNLENEGIELYLLRNLSRGKGIGFFESGNFHPDFILWMIIGNKQYITFIEPHGLIHENFQGEKVQFHKRIEEIQCRIGDPNVILNSFILSWTKYSQLAWNKTKEESEKNNVLFMRDDRDSYIGKMFSILIGKNNSQQDFSATLS